MSNVNRETMTEYIKVNLPLTEQNYLDGNGEGVWVLVDPETKKAHDDDVFGKGYVGILDNDSFYYPGMNCGELIPFEMRGENRPVADFHSFLSKRMKLTPEGKEVLIRQIAAHRIQQVDARHSQTMKPPICCGCRFCVDKNSFPVPDDTVHFWPETPLLTYYYCCCEGCENYGECVTGLRIKECEHFEEL